MPRVVASVVVLGGLLSGCSDTTSDPKPVEDAGVDAWDPGPLQKWDGTPVQLSAPWSPGTSVSIEGVYGGINVVPGATGQMDVSFAPFNYLGSNQGQLANDEMMQQLSFDVSESGGTIIVKAQRTGDNRAIGAAITVSLPAAFDAALSVKNLGEGDLSPGDIDIAFTGSASSVAMSNARLGSCKLSGGDSVKSTNSTCNGPTKIAGVADNVEIVTTGVQTDTAVELSLASVSAGATGGKIETEDGNIALVLPAVGDYVVKGLSPTAGVVDFGSAPIGCTVDEVSPQSKTLTCGAGGPTYSVTAGYQSNSDNNITVGYQ